MNSFYVTNEINAVDYKIAAESNNYYHYKEYAKSYNKMKDSINYWYNAYLTAQNKLIEAERKIEELEKQIDSKEETFIVDGAEYTVTRIVCNGNSYNLIKGPNLEMMTTSLVDEHIIRKYTAYTAKSTDEIGVALEKMKEF